MANSYWIRVEYDADLDKLSTRLFGQCKYGPPGKEREVTQFVDLAVDTSVKESLKKQIEAGKDKVAAALYEAKVECEAVAVKKGEYRSAAK